MTLIERLQKACEQANRVQEEADRLGFDPVDPAPHLAPDIQRAQRASHHASEQAYALSDAILRQRPQSERDAMILLAHLVQQISLIALDGSPETESARDAAQTLLAWHAQGSDAHALEGWAGDMIAQSREHVALRHPEPPMRREQHRERAAIAL